MLIFLLSADSEEECDGGTCHPELESGMFEGDIVLPPEGMRNALAYSFYMWPNGVVPYTFDSNFSKYQSHKVTRFDRR
jgi:hypothetical protein